jgi:hypothetical protein
MKAPNITPGPWRQCTGDFSDQIISVPDFNAARASGLDEDNAYGEALIAETGGNEANARAIAALPDCLDALALFASLCKTDYGKIGQERQCNADYLQKVDRSIAYEKARAALTAAGYSE